MRNETHTIVFALVLGIVCPALLVGVNLFTAQRREANETVDEIRNFLTALDDNVDSSQDAAVLIDIFERDVRVGQTENLTVYNYHPQDSGEAASVAIPFSGMGLWGPVKGVLALESDLKSIRGVRFYQQQETPGLGGEISSEWFQEQFEGKKIVSPTGNPGFTVSMSESRDQNSVDGITGATMTSNRIELMLDDLVKLIDKELVKNVQ